MAGFVGIELADGDPLRALAFGFVVTRAEMVASRRTRLAAISVDVELGGVKPLICMFNVFRIHSDNV
ncbi:MAG: hypothetical protein NT062_37865 [Proteobacteria bacterium]|nr:hypothetical protein [Pseudomonadota bacterium]